MISGSHRSKAAIRRGLSTRSAGSCNRLWPAAREATRIAWRVVTQPEAVFSYRPGLDAQRPPQQTPVSNLLVAGDWTRTGWPATMEGAVRSGYLAVEALLRTLGRPSSILVPDLPRSLFWMARVMARPSRRLMSFDEQGRIVTRSVSEGKRWPSLAYASGYDVVVDTTIIQVGRITH